MSRILVLSIIVASLSTIVGCGASRGARITTSPATVNVAERDESCWTPPEEVGMSFAESKAPAASATTQKATQGSSYRPNRNDRPTSGAVHAATY